MIVTWFNLIYACNWQKVLNLRADHLRLYHSKPNSFWTINLQEKLGTVLKSWDTQDTKTVQSFTNGIRVIGPQSWFQKVLVRWVVLDWYRQVATSFLIHSFIHSFIDSFIHSFIQNFTANEKSVRTSSSGFFFCFLDGRFHFPKFLFIFLVFDWRPVKVEKVGKSKKRKAEEVWKQ